MTVVEQYKALLPQIRNLSSLVWVAQHGEPITQTKQIFEGKKVKGKVSNATANIVLKKYKGLCAYTGNKLDFHTFSVDHLKPLVWFKNTLSKNNPNDLNNLLPCDKEVNFIKSDHSLESFRTIIQSHYDLFKSGNVPKDVKFRKLHNIICHKFDFENKGFDGIFYFEKMTACKRVYQS